MLLVSYHQEKTRLTLFLSNQKHILLLLLQYYKYILFHKRFILLIFALLLLAIFKISITIMSLSYNTIQIESVSSSKIDQVNFDNLIFGANFTDHMFTCDYINGKWENPQIKPYGNLSLSPAAKVFHYGQAIFEGMKAFKDDEGRVFMFRPQENIKRFNKSSVRLAMPEFPETLFLDALKALISLDKEWVKSGFGNALYIRPFSIATQPGVLASPSDEYKLVILLSPVQSYFSGEVKVEVAEKYSRAADGGVGAAKAAGNYAAQFYPTNLAVERGFQQVVWTDSREHKYLEEAGTMNVFFRINDTLITAPTSERILDGVTRKSLIKIAEDMGITVDVRRISIDEVTEASKNGSLKEIFGSGTAAVISPISAISYKGTEYVLPIINEEEKYGNILKQKIMDIQYNKCEDKYGWRVEVK